MDIFKKILSSISIASLLFTQGLIYPIIAYAAITSTFVANETVANVATGVDTQTAVSVTPQPNVEAVTAVAQVNTITIGGTIETGDIFTAHLPGLVDASFTAANTNPDHVAIGLNSAIQASTGYNSRVFTSEVNSNVITLTASTPGTQFTVTSNASNYSGVVQVDDITPTNIEVGDQFTVSGVSVTATDTTAATLVDAFVTAINSAAGHTVTASNNSGVLRLIANVAGTGFTATPSTTNKGAVAQINTITIGGTIEAGDTFTAHLPGPVDATYAAQIGDNTDAVAAGLNTAIQASVGYVGFTSSVTNNVITLTASTAGTAFTVTSDATDNGLGPDFTQSATSATPQGNEIAGTDNQAFTGANITPNTSAGATDTQAATSATTQSNVEAVAAVAQVDTITVSGTVEAGDVFTATVPTDGAIDYVVSTDITTIDIASGLNDAILASTSYASQAFTTSVSGNVVTLTAKVAGTGFTVTSDAANRAAVAQVVTFTPAFVSAGETFRATINGTPYSYFAGSGDTVGTVVSALAPLMDGDGAVTCTEDNIAVTCTADLVGTAFTFDATVVDETVTTTQDDEATINEDSGANTIDVLTNDDGIAKSVTSVTQGSFGMVAITNGGADLTYTPNADFNGSDSFDYVETDSDDNSAATGHVSITVTPVNDNPDAVDDNAVVDEDSGANTVDVLVNDSDTPDNIGETLTITATTDGVNGTVTNNGTDLTYTPNADFNGLDTFTYTISDGNGGSDTANVSVTVNAVNDTSIANDVTDATNEDTAKTITLDATDIDNDPLTYSIVSGPSNGTLSSFDSVAGTVDYTPDADFNGSDSFTYQVNDGTVDSNVATVNLTVNPVNDAPSAPTLSAPTDNTQMTDATPGFSWNASADIDGDAISYNLLVDDNSDFLSPEVDQITGSTNLTASILAVGTYNWKVVANDGTVLVDSATQTFETLTPITSGNQQIVIDDSGPSTINIPSDVANPTLDLTGVSSAVGVTTTATLNNSITLDANNFDVFIPGGINIQGDNWNGILNAPTQVGLNSVVLPITPKGWETSFSSAVEIGFGNTPLTFDRGVKLVLAGQAGKLAGYVRNGVFTKITNTCANDSQATGDALAGGECKIDSGSDLVIWTKHFTQFITYTQAINPSQDGGGAGNAGPGSTPSCSDQKPGNAPRLLKAVTGKNSVTLTWDKAADPVTYYLINYSTISGQFQYGNPNVGGAGTISYTVGGLSGGATYYFKARAGNGCMPGDYSNEIAATPGGRLIQGPASGFATGVLGAIKAKETAKEITTQPSSAPEIQVQNVSQSESQESNNLFAIIFSAIGSFLAKIFGN